MKYTLKKITEGEDEVIVKFLSMTPEIEHLISFLNRGQTRLIGYQNKTQHIVKPDEILYIESVDGKTFAYLKNDVLRLDYQLYQLEELLTGINFFRCSKSMIVNIDKVASLKSLPSNRIDAVMCNGEHVLISRTYASDFRRRLRGGDVNA